jgi:hypothetical protein
MNGFPIPVNVVAKLIIIILTNFPGKTGAQKSVSRKKKAGKQTTGCPPFAAQDQEGRAEPENFFDKSLYI